MTTDIGNYCVQVRFNFTQPSRNGMHAVKLERQDVNAGEMNVAKEAGVSVQEFLKRRPNQSYTTILTQHGGKSAPMLHAHAERLAYGFSQLQNNDSHQASVLTITNALQLVIASLQNGKQTKICVAVILEKDVMHARSFPVPPVHSETVVEVRGDRRSQPGVKNTRWVEQRAYLENVRSKQASETILVDRRDGYAMYEGLVTNLFVVVCVKDRTYEVVTAPANLVLPGTVRACVIQACEELGVVVVEETPRLTEWKSFKAAFLTNVIRLLEPVTAFVVPEVDEDGGVPAHVHIPWDDNLRDFVSLLRERVIAIMDKSAQTDIEDQRLNRDVIAVHTRT